MSKIKEIEEYFVIYHPEHGYVESFNYLNRGFLKMTPYLRKAYSFSIDSANSANYMLNNLQNRGEFGKYKDAEVKKVMAALV